MRVLALMWPTDAREELMINRRRDLIVPAIDGITNELLNLGHTVVYVNVAAEEYTYASTDLSLLSYISGLQFKLWADIRNRQFDVVWHAIKDPTPPAAIPHVERIMADLPEVPVLNPVSQLRSHTKRKYLNALGAKHVGVPLFDEYAGFLNEQGKLDPNKCWPPSSGAHVSKDKTAVRLHATNNARSNLNDDGVTLRYRDNTGVIREGFRSYFRIPFAAGKCLPGSRYFFHPSVLCPKTGHAVSREDYCVPDMRGGTIAAAMNELGVQIAHLEGLDTGILDSNVNVIEIFDVNPFPTSSGASLTPMSVRIAKRLEQVYDI